MPELTTLPNGMQVIGVAPVEQVPPGGYPREFINYVRGFPGQMEATYRDEIARLAGTPEVKQYLASRKDLSPKQQFELVQHQAAVNAQKMSHADFRQMRQRYGVDTFTADTLRAAVRANRAGLSSDKKVDDAAAAAGADAAKTYAEKILPEDVENEVGKLTPYMPFDQPQGAVEHAKPAKAKTADEKRFDDETARMNARATKNAKELLANPQVKAANEEISKAAAAIPDKPPESETPGPVVMADQTAVPEEEKEPASA